MAICEVKAEIGNNTHLQAPELAQLAQPWQRRCGKNIALASAPLHSHFISCLDREEIKNLEGETMMSGFMSKSTDCLGCQSLSCEWTERKTFNIIRAIKKSILTLLKPNTDRGEDSDEDTQSATKEEKKKRTRSCKNSQKRNFACSINWYRNATWRQACWESA